MGSVKMLSASIGKGGYMAIGWIYLYSKYRKVRKENVELREKIQLEEEVCSTCGYQRRDHSRDSNESCPV